jgi:hypothetical protein
MGIFDPADEHAAIIASPRRAGKGRADFSFSTPSKFSRQVKSAGAEEVVGIE